MARAKTSKEKKRNGGSIIFYKLKNVINFICEREVVSYFIKLFFIYSMKKIN